MPRLPLHPLTSRHTNPPRQALYRRGCARNHLGLVDEALVDLNKALEIDPDNKPVKVEVRFCFFRGRGGVRLFRG